MLYEERNSNDLNVNVIKESYVVNTVLSVINNDIESGDNSNSNNNNNDKILKGILKRSNDLEDEDRASLLVLKMCTTLFMIIILTPIIVCDIYFGFNDTSCINETPNAFNYTMKLYLLVSGFMSLSWLLTIIFINCSLSIDNDNSISLICIKYIGVIVVLFNIIWNILGAITFWGLIYKEEICDSKITTYIYVSLIIKLVSSLFELTRKSKKNE